MPRSAIVRFRKRRKDSERRSNPSSGIKSDFIGTIAPAAAAFAATKLFTRIVGTIVARRWPRAARHVAALSSVAAFGGIYYLGDRWQRIRPYHSAAMVGAGVAALTTIAQTYVPKYGWITADWQAGDMRQLPPAASNPALEEPEGDEFTSYEDEVGATEAAMNAPSFSYSPPQPAAQTELTAAERAAVNAADREIDVEGDGEADLESLAAGVFAN